MTNPHQHKWTRSKRIHGRPGRFFVECACSASRQATIKYGHLHVFTTGAARGGKTTVKSYRLKPWQGKILQQKKQTFVEFVDAAFLHDNMQQTAIDLDEAFPESVEEKAQKVRDAMKGILNDK
jgi:hypothetical protein